MSEQLVMDMTAAEPIKDARGGYRSGNFPWTDEDIENLKRWRAQGWSFGAIASTLGCTRNAAIGKAGRLGICEKRPREAKSHKQPLIRLYEGRPRKAYTRKAPTILEQPILDCVPLNLTFAELKPGQCKYPFGDVPNMLFCGLPTDEGCSWCAPHHRVVFAGKPTRPNSPWRDQTRTPAARFA